MSDPISTPRPDDAPTEVIPGSAQRDDGFDFDLDGELPPPPARRRRAPLFTVTLGTCAAIGLGVVLGIVIQKHWGGSSGASAGGRSAFAAAFAGRGGTTGAAGGSTAAAGGRSGSSGFTRSGTIGQVKAIDGRSLYVTDLSGNTIRVTSPRGVQIRVTSAGTLKRIRPGDYVTVQGTQTAAGYRATSITDSGTTSPVGGGVGAFGGGGFGGTGSTRGGTGTGGGSSSGGSGGGSVPALPGLGGG